MGKSKDKEECYLENWEERMKDWLLDPETVRLDEKEFRIDFLDTTDAFIVEVETENICPDELILKKSDHQLVISIRLKDEIKERCRYVEFPFCLRQRDLSYSLEHHTIEITVPKQECTEKTSLVTRVQGICNDRDHIS
ncbi:Hsp20/alpha crystallin family protein [Rossellomorea aquimaris]|uniref:Hsp20/alpha crystallin family protein n=1 Tax=Rossellomorea aquimaris TaxID=189382 RepID=UPI001CD3F672|nr:Hsp20/alpha crystallin family protein [Rossellomorea aquimaris]MCA1053828.1 Hsp20/alpha crystallin family protein [Rossellomorea aquimaris]